MWRACEFQVLNMLYCRDVNHRARSNRISSRFANVRKKDPFIIQLSLKLESQLTNLTTCGAKIPQEQDVQPMLLHYLNNTWKRIAKSPKSNADEGHLERTAPYVRRFTERLFLQASLGRSCLLKGTYNKFMSD
jgi:hypothetical protein